MRGVSEESMNFGTICKTRLLRLKRLMDLQTEQYRKEVELECSAVEFLEIILSRLKKATARLGYVRSQRSRSALSRSVRSRVSDLRRETEEGDSHEVPKARGARKRLRLGLGAEEEPSFIGPLSSRNIGAHVQHKRVSSVRIEAERPLIRTFSPAPDSLSSRTNELNEPNDSRKRHSVRTKVFESHISNFEQRPTAQVPRTALSKEKGAVGLSNVHSSSRQQYDVKRSRLPKIELTTNDFKETSIMGSRAIESMIEMGFLKRNPLSTTRATARQDSKLNATLNLKGNRARLKEPHEHQYKDNF